MKALVITHTDLDGVAAGYILTYGLERAGYEVTLKHKNYGKVTAKVLEHDMVRTYDDVFFTDVFPETDDAWDILKDDTVTILDHHESALKTYVPMGHKCLKHVEINPYGSRSAAWICLDYIRNDLGIEMHSGFESLAEYVADWDLWKHEIPEAEVLGYASYIMPNKSFHKELSKREPGWITDAISVAYESALLQIEHSRNLYERSSEYCELKWKGEVYPMVAGICFGFHSLIADDYRDKYVVYIYDAQTGSFSFRNKGVPGIDLNELAEALGGGGHKMAAGFQDKEMSKFALYPGVQTIVGMLKKHLQNADLKKATA